MVFWYRENLTVSITVIFIIVFSIISLYCPTVPVRQSLTVWGTESSCVAWYHYIAQLYQWDSLLQFEALRVLAVTWLPWFACGDRVRCHGRPGGGRVLGEGSNVLLMGYGNTDERERGEGQITSWTHSNTCALNYNVSTGVLKSVLSCTMHVLSCTMYVLGCTMHVLGCTVCVLNCQSW